MRAGQRAVRVVVMVMLMMTVLAVRVPVRVPVPVMERERARVLPPETGHRLPNVREARLAVGAAQCRRADRVVALEEARERAHELGLRGRRLLRARVRAPRALRASCAALFARTSLASGTLATACGPRLAIELSFLKRRRRLWATAADRER